MLTDLADGCLVRVARRHQQDCCRCRLIVTESNLLLDTDIKCHTHLKQHVIKEGARVEYRKLQAKTPGLSFNHIHNTDTSILATTSVMGKNKDTEVDKVAGVATDDDVGKSELQLEHMSAVGSETVPGCWE